MFASIRQYTVNPDRMEELIASLPEVVEVISALPGFVSYNIVRGAGNVLLSTSLFQTEAQAQASSVVAAEWVRQNIAALFAGPPGVVSGPVVYRRTA